MLNSKLSSLVNLHTYTLYIIVPCDENAANEFSEALAISWRLVEDEARIAKGRKSVYFLSLYDT